MAYKLLVHSAKQLVQVVDDGTRVKAGRSMNDVAILEGNAAGYSVLVDRYVFFNFENTISQKLYNLPRQRHCS